MLSIAICWPRKSATYGYFQDRCGNKERPAKLAKGSFYGVFSPQHWHAPRRNDSLSGP